jgi:hypothetical protein
VVTRCLRYARGRPEVTEVCSRWLSCTLNKSKVTEAARGRPKCLKRGWGMDEVYP